MDTTNNTHKKNGAGILQVKKSEQYRTVEELMEAGKPGGKYYLLLVLSSLVVSAGILVGNAAIVIGGMLITPILTPVLLIALGFSIGDIGFVKKTGLFVGKSLFAVAAGAAFLGFLFGVNGEPSLFVLDNTLRGAVLYFIVALASGFSATYAWVRKEINEILPGVAVAVSLVPPLALLGIGLAGLQFAVIRFNLFIFFFNLIGVLVGSLIVFSLFKFYKVERKVAESEAKTGT